MRGTDKITRMVSLRAGEVSLVKSPAVPDAKFVVVKEEEVQPDATVNVDQVVHTQPVDKETDKLVSEFISVKAYDAFCKSMIELFETVVNKQSEKIDKALQEIKAALKNDAEPEPEAPEPEKPEQPADTTPAPTEGQEQTPEGQGQPTEKNEQDPSCEEPNPSSEVTENPVDILLEAGALLQTKHEKAAMSKLELALSKASELIKKLEVEKEELQRSLRKAQGKDPEGDGE